MKLVSVQVHQFKSIEHSTEVQIDPAVTVLVGQNEAGKTAFLQALERARSVENTQFKHQEDYPRARWTAYEKRHKALPDDVVTLAFSLSDNDVKSIDGEFGEGTVTGRNIIYTVDYNNDWRHNFANLIDARPYIAKIVQEAELGTDLNAQCFSADTIEALQKVIDEADLNTAGESLRDKLKKRFGVHHGPNLLADEIYHNYLDKLPQFLYFDDYKILPGKINLAGLKNRREQKQLSERDETALRLLAMAGLDLNQLLTGKTVFSEACARLESVSNNITDSVFTYWTQNKDDLEVIFSIATDPHDPDANFQNGPNLYLQIKNHRHRASVSFDQRSKGFIWFFSFIVWFNSLPEDGGNHILLLDEPGLNLHALAQADLLRYIDDLAQEHQVIYTTHSPFMVYGDRLHQVRVVEDRDKMGTVISSNLMGSNAKTIFPLQAALGYSIAQNLFISPRNLLVEGPADLLYLRYMSDQLEAAGRTSLREDITIAPTGGLDKLATFVALLGANELEMAVLHDWASQVDPRLESLVREQLIKRKRVLNYGQFRVNDGTDAPPSTDVEDLLSPELYLQLFYNTYQKQLNGQKPREDQLPEGDRIVERLSRFLKQENITLRDRGGYNHFAVANHLVQMTPVVDASTLDRFERLFKAINGLFTSD